MEFGVSEHQVGDQNVGLQVHRKSGLWDWSKDHEAPEIAWICEQLKHAEQDGVVRFQKNKLDCSDAGMLYWWITGATKRGNKHASPAGIQAIILTGFSGDSTTK